MKISLIRKCICLFLETEIEINFDRICQSVSETEIIFNTYLDS